MPLCKDISILLIKDRCQSKKRKICPLQSIFKTIKTLIKPYTCSIKNITTYKPPDGTKKRYGYFEKPSVLKRKRKKMKLNLSQRNRALYYCYHEHPQHTLWLKIDVKQQFSRTGKNAMGY